MIKYALAAAIALAGLTTITHAADPATPRRQQGQNRLEQLAKTLKLNDDQKAKMESILKKEGEKMQELRKDTSLSREDRMAKMLKIREESEPEIKKVLTTEQFDQYKKMIERRRQGGRNRGAAPQQ